MKLTFHLKKDVKWHDGEALTSEDVKWTFDTMIANKWSKSDSLASVESIECPDDLTVVLNMKVKDVSIVSKLGWYATFIMPEHIWNDPQYKDFTSNPANWQPVGSGPYKFDNYKSGVATTLVKNSDYFDGEPIIEKLIFTIVPDSTTAFQSFVNGEIDYFNIIVPTANKHDLDNNPDYRFFDYISINRTYLTFNMKEGRFTDPRLRRRWRKGSTVRGFSIGFPMALALWQNTLFRLCGKANTLISSIECRNAISKVQRS